MPSDRPVSASDPRLHSNSSRHTSRGPAAIGLPAAVHDTEHHAVGERRWDAVINRAMRRSTEPPLVAREHLENASSLVASRNGLQSSFRARRTWLRSLAGNDWNRASAEAGDRGVRWFFAATRPTEAMRLRARSSSRSTPTATAPTAMFVRSRPLRERPNGPRRHGTQRIDSRRTVGFAPAPAAGPHSIRPLVDATAVQTLVAPAHPHGPATRECRTAVRERTDKGVPRGPPAIERAMRSQAGHRVRDCVKETRASRR